MPMDWSSFDRGVFLVNVLGIVQKHGKVLIGRREKDPYVEELAWSFPGGRLHYGKSIEESLKSEVKVKTGLDVEVKKLIFARVPEEKREFLLLYYYCEVIGGEEKAGEKFVEIKWVKPMEVREYFTTSLDSAIMDFLKQL
jgi:ADP-ribose pyrophosphatase YjhB (NUDIX family)